MASSSITSDTVEIPSTHQTSLVGGTLFEQYRSETTPCTRKITADELSLFEADATKTVGKTFMPVNGENSWEVLEVVFNTKGWSSITVQFEGAEKHHKMEFADFTAMLRSGSLQVVELD